ncbi:peptidylprolyl isomerase [Azoarcus olearius]|uniref:Peptidyl-prolyl cis-trans isomerase n=1 Tax=Azoarcus sp. (strain BH72) TaxID=418699 RepID=A1K4B9_AZOSB|nr:peptidylprolyl isomerase [Azoarcus olearius]ANQ84222.1 peptidyl-prolyl cis-trans isomerase A [Azoarcus olearius]CAL93674.1 probable peptidyl-prolyl cis-trans isomerase A [Azoarcus olearius]
MKRLIAFLALSTWLGLAAAANPQVLFTTNQGELVVELYPEKAPKTVANFLQYVKDKHYDGTIFHRVINGFMIQGGGMDAAMKEKSTRAPIENEAKNGLRNEPGTLAMARTGDPHSATAQFFINVAPNSFLDYPSRDGWGYAVFGKVVRGLDVVDTIARVPTRNVGFHQNVPAEPVVIQSARVIEAQPAGPAAR